MTLAVIHAIACTVVARGSADRDSQGSRILACSIERHHGLLSPLIFRSSPADRDHRGIICGVMNRGGEGIEKTSVGLRGAGREYRGVFRTAHRPMTSRCPHISHP